MKILALVLTSILLFSTPTHANLFDGVYEDKSRLAQLDTATGQYNAGVSLLRTVQSYAGAAKWFHRAALQGHAKSRAVLGSLYAVGLGVEKDFVIAYAWVSLAVPQLEGKMLDRATALLDELESLMTQGQITEAKEKSRTISGLDR